MMNTFDILARGLTLSPDSADPLVWHAAFTPHADFPPFRGHFPDRPILPGIAQISIVTAALEKALARTLSLDGIKRIKFLAPALPEVELVLTITLSAPQPPFDAAVVILSGDTKISILKLRYAEASI